MSKKVIYESKRTLSRYIQHWRTPEVPGLPKTEEDWVLLRLIEKESDTSPGDQYIVTLPVSLVDTYFVLQTPDLEQTV